MSELYPEREVLVTKQQAPRRIRLELVRPVTGESEPIVIKTKMINKTAELVPFKGMKPLPRAYFVSAIIKRTTTVPRYILGLIPHGTRQKVDFVVRFNAYWSEALESLQETVPKFSQELENLKLGDDMTQQIEGHVETQKFKIDSTMLKLMLIVLAMSIPFGLFMDVLLHLIPSQIVVWSP